MIASNELETRPMTLSIPKLEQVWAVVSKNKTLFSDYTRADFESWCASLTDENMYALDVYKHNALVGMIFFRGVSSTADVQMEVVFFDRQPKEKALLVKEAIHKVFNTFPIQRLSVEIPAIYYGIGRLVKALGFVSEGRKRQAVLMGGRWLDVDLYGLTRSDL